MNYELERRLRGSRWAALALLVAVALVAVTAVASDAAPRDKQTMIDFETGQPITGSFSMLDRSDDAIATKIRTRTQPGNAVTIWYVLFNAPENCSDDMCGEDDIFIDGDPTAGFNAEGIADARISVVYGGDGDVANPAGRIALDGGLTEGEVPDGPARIVIGRAEDGALVPLSPATGLEDAMTAEVHIVLQDHGPAHDDPELLEAQLTRFQGACNPDCVDVQFAVHK